MYGELCWLWLGVGEGGEGNGSPLQYSKSMGRGAWWAAVHGVAKSQTRLSDFTFTFYFHALEKEMATHSSVLAWRIPGTGEPGGLPSMGSHRVGHNWSDLAAVGEALGSRSLFYPPLPMSTKGSIHISACIQLYLKGWNKITWKHFEKWQSYIGKCIYC